MKTLKTLLDNTEKVGDCLLWLGCLNSDGYARCLWEGSVNGKVHRIVYQLTHPDENIKGKSILHSCDNPVCINPEHLSCGTPTENMRDRTLKGRTSSKITAKDALAIRTLYGTGRYTLAELGTLFNITGNTVGYITRRQTWRWVD